MKNKQSGMTLIESLVCIIILGLVAMLCAGMQSLHKAANRYSDIRTIPLIVYTASHHALYQQTYWGLHYDSLSNTLGLFKDDNKNRLRDPYEPLVECQAMAHGSRIVIQDDADLGYSDITFNRIGTPAIRESFAISYISANGDTTVYGVQAATGKPFLVEE